VCSSDLLERLLSEPMTWEERWHPLREEWIIVAAHRQDRPWSGATIPREEEKLPDYVADCYLCPGNPRVSGKVNPNYSQTFVFDNDHPSVSPEAPANLDQPTGIYRNQPARGIARVVCYSPKHNLTLGELELTTSLHFCKSGRNNIESLVSGQKFLMS